MSEIQPALLTRAELDWLLGNKEVSKLYERKIRYSIKKKIETLAELEIPLLMNWGFNVTTYSNGVTANGNTSRLGEHRLVGRGIADLDDDVDKLCESSKREKRGEWESRVCSVVIHSRHFEPTCPFGHGISNPQAYLLGS